MSKTINIPFAVAGQLLAIIHKFKAPRNMGDVAVFMTLKGVLEEVEQEKQMRWQEALTKHNIPYGTRIPENSPAYPDVLAIINAESSTPVSKVQVYEQDEIWHFLGNDNSVAMADVALAAEYLVKPKHPSKNKKQTQN